MTVALHDAAVGRIAQLDPDLPHLADALRVGLTRPGWRLHDVRWTPGEGCRLAFSVEQPAAPRGFVAVDVTPAGWAERDFRSDPALPGLPDAADPARVAQLLAPHVRPAPTACVVEPVRYRPGSRCVLRYRLDGAAPAEVYAKALTRRARATADAWQALAGAPRDGSADALVPPYLGEWHDHDVLLAGAVHGPTVASVLSGRVPAPEPPARLAARLGTLLARLHRHSDVEAPTRTGDDQLDALHVMVPVVRRVDRGLADRLAAVVDSLRDHRPEPGPAVLAHGGFRAGQCVVTAGGALVVLDLDGLHHGDAARDVATALAHLAWQAVKQPALRPTMREAAEAFVQAYQRLAGPLPDDSLAWWRAAALTQLVGRRYRRLEVADWPLLPAVIELAESLLPRPGARRAASPPVARRAPRSEIVRAALQRVAAVPEGVAVEMTEVLGATTRRTVHEYVVRGLDGPRPVTVIAKAFHEAGRAELVHRHLSVLADAFPGADLRVPAPLALVADHHLVLFRAGTGTPLERVEELDRATDGVRGAARWLARLHRSAVSLPRRLELDREETTTREWAAVIGEHHPDLLTPATALAEGWRAALDAERPGWVPIHRDFHAGHVLVGDGVCVIDLDEARLGDPALDVAHFVTYLELRRPQVTADALREGFLAEYTSAGGPVRGVEAGYVAYTWLKIAKQWAAGRAHGRDANARRRRLGVEEALQRGQACLGG